MLTGHSLGAATACCLAKLLYDRRRGCFFEGFPSISIGFHHLSAFFLWPFHRLYVNTQLLKCYAYATPPCLDRESALHMAGYTTSVVHHDDFVVRASLYNCKLMVHAWREAKRLMDAEEFEVWE